MFKHIILLQYACIDLLSESSHSCSSILYKMYICIHCETDSVECVLVLVDPGSCYVTQAHLEHLALSDAPASAFQFMRLQA